MLADYDFSINYFISEFFLHHDLNEICDKPRTVGDIISRFLDSTISPFPEYSLPTFFSAKNLSRNAFLLRYRMIKLFFIRIL